MDLVFSIFHFCDKNASVTYFTNTEGLSFTTWTLLTKEIIYSNLTKCIVLQNIKHSRGGEHIESKEQHPKVVWGGQRFYSKDLGHQSTWSIEAGSSYVSRVWCNKIKLKIIHVFISCHAINIISLSRNLKIITMHFVILSERNM